MATLPDVPKGKELEDFVAALLQCTHHFVEKNIREPDVLELDVVATSYATGRPEHRLFEVKGSKDWGFSEIFKLLGQMTYLGIRRGGFIATRPPQDKLREFYKDRCNTINIDLLIIEDIERARALFNEAGYGLVDERLHVLWRYSFWAERCLIQVIRQEAKNRQHAKAPREALRYYDLINNGVFLARDAKERVEQLYDAYRDHPKLTLGAAREMAGDAFDTTTPGDCPLVREALLEGKHRLLHACMYLEHRARLSILKGAVDYLCERVVRGGASGRRVGIDLGLLSLPSSFVSALSRIGKEPYFWLYPLFWQVFLWGWGGFILKDHEEEEMAELSAQTGLPVEYIPEALEVFDRLFPTAGGWLKEVSTASYRLVIMVPWPFYGLGAFQRLRRRAAEQYSELGLSGLYTAHDLVKWHNAGAQLLDQWGKA